MSQYFFFPRPFVLRRLKKDVLHHLPAKIEHKELVTLLQEQRAVYDNLVKSFSKKVRAIGNVNDARKNSAFVKASRYRTECSYIRSVTSHDTGSTFYLEFTGDFNCARQGNK